MFIDNLSHKFEVQCDVIGSASAETRPGSVTLRTRRQRADKRPDLRRSFVGRFFVPCLTRPICVVRLRFFAASRNDTKEFITGGSLTLPNGSNAGVYLPAAQAVYTFRPALGSGSQNRPPGTFVQRVFRKPLTATGVTEINNMASFITGLTNFIIARNRSFSRCPSERLSFDK